MKVASRDTDREVLLIAEIGNNHEGDPATAQKMVEAAAGAGVHAVKMQVIDGHRLVHCSQAKRIAQLAQFRLPDMVFAELAETAKSLGLLFIASIFDLDNFANLVHLLDAVKIASGDLDFHPLLREAASSGKPVILSTGMSSLDEIKAAADVIAANLPNGRSLDESLALLHCVSLYPAPLEDANLGCIRTLREAFGLTVGYSDHTLGLDAAGVAMAAGARIIEKHFTLDKTRSTFRDHALSADPQEMKHLADLVRVFDRMMGNGGKQLCAAEREMAVAARRSVVAARDLPAGTVLTLQCLDFVRPRSGLPPAAADAIIGRRTRVALKQHDTVLWEHLEGQN
jgi:N,N'-diacetyllegionaminate synthase